MIIYLPLSSIRGSLSVNERVFLMARSTPPFFGEACMPGTHVGKLCVCKMGSWKFENESPVHKVCPPLDFRLLAT